MSEMIERCDEAACQLDDMFRAIFHQEERCDIIRAIIAAMREPTEGMMVAAENASPILLTFADKEESASYIAWQVMIDSALK